MKKVLLGLIILVSIVGVLITIKFSKKEQINLKKVDIVRNDLNNGENLRVIKNGKFVVTDLNGVVLSDVYDNIKPFQEGLAVVKKGNKYGFINEKYKIVVPLKYKYVNNFINGYAIVVGFNDKFGIIDRKGKEVLSPLYYDFLSSVGSNGRVRASNFKEKSEVIIDVYGNVLQ